LDDTIGLHPAELLDVWNGWHTISPPMRKDYERFVALSNKGAKELGFKDTGAMWRSGYDMPPDDFSKELDRLWEQVKPLTKREYRIAARKYDFYRNCDVLVITNR